MFHCGFLRFHILCSADGPLKRKGSNERAESSLSPVDLASSTDSEGDSGDDVSSENEAILGRGKRRKAAPKREAMPARRQPGRNASAAVKNMREVSDGEPINHI